jgi:ADP-heptose:LPS heptosyltransferase
MNVRVLQQIDRWIGVPLCIALTGWRRIADTFRVEEDDSPERILVVKLAEQGSTVLAQPALREAVKRVGAANVFFLAFEDNRFILDLLEIIPPGNVFTLPADSPVRFCLGALRVLKSIRHLKISVAIDMEFFSRGSAAVAYLCGANKRIGFHPFHGGGPYRGDLLTHRLVYNPHLHTSDAFLSLVRALDRKPRDFPALDFEGSAPGETLTAGASFKANERELKDVQALVRKETGGNPRLILLNPNASDLLPLRKWPSERYAQLAEQLLERFPEVVVGFTGGPMDVVATEALARQLDSPRCVSFAGKTTLRQLLVLFTQASVLVTNDSGPAHFATLTPIEVVTLFGPETPELFAARTPRNTILWARLACSPCVSAYNNRESACRNNLCMQALTVEQVFEATVRAYLKGI